MFIGVYRFGPFEISKDTILYNNALNTLKISRWTWMFHLLDRMSCQRSAPDVVSYGHLDVRLTRNGRSIEMVYFRLNLHLCITSYWIFMHGVTEFPILTARFREVNIQRENHCHPNNQSPFRVQLAFENYFVMWGDELRFEETGGRLFLYIHQHGWHPQISKFPSLVVEMNPGTAICSPKTWPLALQLVKYRDPGGSGGHQKGSMMTSYNAAIAVSSWTSALQLAGDLESQGNSLETITYNCMISKVDVWHKALGMEWWKLYQAEWFGMIWRVGRLI